MGRESTRADRYRRLDDHPGVEALAICAASKNDGVTELPKVILLSPLVSVGEREGVELILASVEAWPDEIVIRMCGRPSPLTQRLEDDFHTALEAWHREAREGEAPEDPGARILGLDLFVTDDVGTSYKLFSAARGGTGTMFRADWIFAPGPPETARRLNVRVAHGAETEVDLGRA
jgi:hypothetical protein